MNKTMLGIVVSVCFLGMGLIMFTEHSSREQKSASVQENVASAPQIVHTQALPNESEKEVVEKSEEKKVKETRPLRDKTDRVTATVAPLAPKEKPKEEKPQAKTSKQTDTPPLHPIAKTEEEMRTSEKERVKPKQEAKESKTETSQKEKEDKAKESKKEEAKSSQEASKKQADDVSQIQKFVVYSRDKGATVRLVSKDPIKYKTLQIHSPERIFVDLEGKWDMASPAIPKNPLVSNIRLGKQSDKTRIVVDLKEKPRNSRIILSNDKRTLDIRVDQ